jgi:hypothetical protein
LGNFGNATLSDTQSGEKTLKEKHKIKGQKLGRVDNG